MNRKKESLLQEATREALERQPSYELEIYYAEYAGYRGYNEDLEMEQLSIPMDKLIEWMEDDGHAMEKMRGYILDKGDLYESHGEEMIEDLKLYAGLKVLPETWKMAPHEFRRFMCEILELNYHAAREEILRAVERKMEGA